MAQQQVAATIEKAEKNVNVKGGGGGGGGSRDVEITLLRQEGLKTEQIRVLTSASTWDIQSLRCSNISLSTLEFWMSE